MAMRKLTESELNQVKKAISEKKLFSAELLVEIYDHYVTHLESYPEREFQNELNGLEEKWSNSYCKKLQYNLEKTYAKSLRTSQWLLIKSYYSWPKAMFTLVLVILLTLFVDTFPFKTQILILFGLPLVFLAGFALVVNLQNRARIDSIRKMLGKPSFSISSSFISKLSQQIVFPLHFYNLFLNVPRIFGWTEQIPESILNALSVTFCFLIVLHSFSIYEAWKIKSKTTLI